ncbi:MAG: hypothetical protein GOU98_02615 [Candidatus Altiarchaeota archaeon]|nr:hypothetical protein [Candidatus Altiarchaeota archaeon]
MQSKWIGKSIEYHIGKEPILFVAPHRGEIQVEIKDGDKTRKIQIGEVGTGHLVKLAAKEVGGSYIVVYVPRLKADFARDPKLLGKGETFRQKLHGKKFWFESHKDTKYKKMIDDFHKLIRKINPKFVIDIHNMGSSNEDARLGFGKDRRYINGTRNALQFRDELVSRLDEKMHILVSKTELTGESEYILYKYEKGRLAMLIELSSSLGLNRKKGVYDEKFQTLIKEVAKLAREWITKENLQ